ncbi:MAG: hypothetical protein JNM63_18330 [Spirochaetia bacterium]|nr:hypothetical protein [Spirochaetia bacterium]
MHVIHTGFDPENNRERRPALPILQLLESFPKETQNLLVVKHRLQPHDPLYWENGTAVKNGLVNFNHRDRSLLDVSRAEKMEIKTPPPGMHGRAASDQPFTPASAGLNISVSDLRALLDKPMKLYYRESLDLRMDEYEDEDPDLETWTVPFLEQFALVPELLRTPPEKIETLFQDLRRSGRLHDGFPGFSQRKHLASWSENFHKSWTEKSLEPTSLFLSEETGSRAEREGLVFSGPKLDSTRGSVLVTGSIEGAWKNSENQIAAFTRFRRNFSKEDAPSAKELRALAHEFYLPYVNALCAAAAGAFTSGSLALITPDRVYRIALAFEKQKAMSDLGVWVNALLEHLQGPLPLFNELLHKADGMDYETSAGSFLKFFEGLAGGGFFGGYVDPNNASWLSDEKRLKAWLADPVRRRVFELSKLFQPVREAVEACAESMPEPEKKSRTKKTPAKAGKT